MLMFRVACIVRFGRVVRDLTVSFNTFKWTRIEVKLAAFPGYTEKVRVIQNYVS